LLLCTGCSTFYSTQIACDLGNGDRTLILTFTGGKGKGEIVLHSKATIIVGETFNIIKDGNGKAFALYDYSILDAVPGERYVAHIGEIKGLPFIKIRVAEEEVLSLVGDSRRSGDVVLEGLESDIEGMIAKPDPIGPFLTLSTEKRLDSSLYRRYLMRARAIVRRFNSKE
jgi:hypothetical protein